MSVDLDDVPRLKRSRADIETISTDMSPAYIQAVKKILKYGSSAF